MLEFDDFSEQFELYRSLDRLLLPIIESIAVGMTNMKIINVSHVIFQHSFLFQNEKAAKYFLPKAAIKCRNWKKLSSRWLSSIIIPVNQLVYRLHGHCLSTWARIFASVPLPSHLFLFLSFNSFFFLLRAENDCSTYTRARVRERTVVMYTLAVTDFSMWCSPWLFMPWHKSRALFLDAFYIRRCEVESSRSREELPPLPICYLYRAAERTIAEKLTRMGLDLSILILFFSRLG